MVMHDLHTRDVLGDDNEGLAFALIGNDAGEFGDSVANDHVDAGRPALLVTGFEDLIANRCIVASPLFSPYL